MGINHYYAWSPSKDYVQVCKNMQPPVVKTRRNTVADIPLAEPRSTLYGVLIIDALLAL